MTARCARCDAESGVPAASPQPEGWSRRTSSAGREIWLCDGCADGNDDRRSTASTGDAAADRLRLFVERYERLDEEAEGIASDKRDVISELRSQGYDGKAFKEIIRRRKMEPHNRREFLGILETYEAALGME